MKRFFLISSHKKYLKLHNNIVQQHFWSNTNGKIPRGGGRGGGGWVWQAPPGMENPEDRGPKGMDSFWNYTIVYLISDSYLQNVFF